MKNNRCMRFLAVLLSVTIMMLPQINAVCGISTETDSAAQASAPAGTSQKLPVKTVDASDIPAAVGIDTALKKGHIQRLYNQEPDLNTVIFKNADGSKTAYYYNYPVKYTDENGKVKDITLDIVSSTKAAGAFESKDTFAKSAFSHKLTDGITLTSDDVSLRLVPVFERGGAVITPIKPGAEMQAAASASSPTAVLSDNKVVYAYDSKTSYEYTLTYAGFKEDIVVSEYTGQTEYTFILYTNGLTLTEIKDDYYLCNEKGEIKAALGSIIIFTADWQNNTFGSMSAESIIENEEYLLTIHVDAEYLSDPKTKYPIRIDPTLTVSFENYGAGAIEDIVVNSADELSGSDGEISAGKWGSDNSVSRILMRFPNLSDELAAMGSITSATVYIHDLMCQHEYLTLDCYPFTGPAWSESNATWDNTAQDSFSASGLPLLDSYEISYYTGITFETPQEYAYDITDAVAGWKSGAYDIEKGIIFKAADDHEADPTHNYKTFASYNRANYKPYLVIEYTEPDPDFDDLFNIIYVTKDVYPSNDQTQIEYWINENVPITDVSITWQSSDLACVSVNSSGQITAHTVGSAVITGTAVYGDIVDTDTITIYSLLENGVYKIFSDDSWILNVSNEGNPNSSSVSIMDFYDDTAGCYWKITHLQDGQYSLRPMSNPMMILRIADDNISLVVQNNVATNDTASLRNTNCAWILTEKSGNFEIKSAYGSTSKVLCSSGMSVSLDAASSVDDSYTWSLYSEIYEPRIIVYSTIADSDFYTTYTSLSSASFVKYAAKHETVTIEHLGLTVIYSCANNSSQNFFYSVSEGGIIDENTGTFAGADTGYYTITISKAGLEFEFVIRVTYLCNGTYYLKNMLEGKYLELSDLADDFRLMDYVIGMEEEHWIIEQQHHCDAVKIKSKSTNAVIYNEMNGDCNWQIVSAGNDRYFICAYNHVEYRLGSGADGMFYLIQGSTSYDVTWCFYDVVIPIYTYYDESIAHNQHFMNSVDYAYAYINNIYGTNFGITFQRSTMPDQFFPIDDYNVANPCCTGMYEPCDAEYGCPENCSTQHHKSSVVIANRIYQNRDRGKLYILWTNRGEGVFCDSATSEHSVGDGYAWVWPDLTPSVIHVASTSYYGYRTAPSGTSDDANISGYESRFMAGLITHEIAHTFGMDDAYNYRAGHASQHDMICIMSTMNGCYDEFFDYIGQNPEEAFCDECREDIYGYIQTNHLE